MIFMSQFFWRGSQFSCEASVALSVYTVKWSWFVKVIVVFIPVIASQLQWKLSPVAILGTGKWSLRKGLSMTPVFWGDATY